MKSIKLINGDISFDSVGRLEWIEGDELLIQSINLKLNTLKETLFYDDNYGHPLFKGKLNKETLENYFKETLIDDERINDLYIIYFEEISGKLNRGKYKVEMEIVKGDGEIISFETII